MDRYHFANSPHLVMRAAETLGVPRDEILHDAGVSDSELLVSAARSPWSVLRRITASAVRLSNEPALGLLAGAIAELGDFGILGLYRWNLPTVGEAHRFGFAEIQPFTSNMLRMWHEVDDENVKICIAPNPPLDPVMDVHIHVAAAIQVTMLKRILLGANAPISEVSLTASGLGDPQRLEQMVGIPVRLGQERNYVVAPKEILQRRIPTASPTVRDLLRTEFEATMRDVKQSQLTTIAVRREIERQVSNGSSPALLQISDTLRVPTRTLRERLRMEGTSFRVQVDIVRRNLTFRELSVPGTKLAAVAAQMGFGDAAAFTRAFRRWTGAAPSEWQRSTALRA